MVSHDLVEEAELITRFVQSYRRRFAAAIALLNHRPNNTELEAEIQCLRLCVETMDMVLSNQERLARSISRLAPPPRPFLKAA